MSDRPCLPGLHCRHAEDRDRLAARVAELENRLKFTHPVFNNATKGPVHMEPDGALPGDRDGVYRIVRDEDARRFAEDYKTTARPPYLATVYSFDDAVLCMFAFNEFENTLREFRRLSEENDRLAAELAAAREELDEWARRFEAIQVERDSFGHQLAAARAEVAKLTKQLTTCADDCRMTAELARTCLARAGRPRRAVRGVQLAHRGATEAQRRSSGRRRLDGSRRPSRQPVHRGRRAGLVRLRKSGARLERRARRPRRGEGAAVMRYSRRVVEEACELLSAWASNRDPHDPTREPMAGCAESLFGHYSKGHRLALEAWAYVDDINPFRDGAEQDAEAEALLRCGWRPGCQRPATGRGG
jgi:hypothetical protein